VIKKPVGAILTGGGPHTNSMIVMQENRCIDLPSNDQNMIYAYEGEGSEVGSLSSLQSSTYADKDLDYDFLRECGPKFVKLSNIYVKSDVVDVCLPPDYHHQNFAFEYNDDQMRAHMMQQQQQQHQQHQQGPR
jgi:hypothetical protein